MEANAAEGGVPETKADVPETDVPETSVPETKADVPETDVPKTETAPLDVEDVGVHVGDTLPVCMISFGDQDCPIVTSGRFGYEDNTVTIGDLLIQDQVDRCNYAFGNYGAERCVDFINAPVVGLGENSVIVEIPVCVDDENNIIGLFVRGEDLGWTIGKCHVTLINGVCDFSGGVYELVRE